MVPGKLSNLIRSLRNMSHLIQKDEQKLNISDWVPFRRVPPQVEDSQFIQVTQTSAANVYTHTGRMQENAEASAENSHTCHGLDLYVTKCKQNKATKTS